MKNKSHSTVSPINRRKFIGMAVLGTAGVSLLPSYAYKPSSSGSRKIRIGIVGGNFGAGFYFHEHPDCIVEAVSDLIPERRERLMKVYHCSKSYESLKLLLRDPKIEAVFLATPVPDHASHVLETLQAGKHVLCAVPLATSLDDCERILEAVKRTGLTYMMAETTTFRQPVIQARIWFEEGRFGKIFSAEGEYYHPNIANLWFNDDRQRTWRQGQPPMYYATHATSQLIAVTGERCTRVSCIGWGDNDFLLKPNPYDNPFWCQTALFNTNKGTAFRVQHFRKGALMPTERGEWHGEKMSYYSADQNGFGEVVVHAPERTNDGYTIGEPVKEDFQSPRFWKTDMLPEPLRHDSGHDGSHCFLTNEFIDALAKNRKPKIDIYEAIAFTVPGIVAHQSALKDGECMNIPDFE
jgi:predicted dehydrogenase